MASGDSLILFPSQSAQVPSSAGAAFDVRNNHPVLDYDDTTQEAAYFTAVMPQGYAGGGVTVVLHYSASSATTGSIAWDVAFERIGDGIQDTDADGFAASNSGGEAVPGTSGDVGQISITFTDGADMDSVAAGDLFRLRVERDADGTNNTDDASGDAELHAVEIRET